MYGSLRFNWRRPRSIIFLLRRHPFLRYRVQLQSYRYFCTFPRACFSRKKGVARSVVHSSDTIYCDIFGLWGDEYGMRLTVGMELNGSIQLSANDNISFKLIQYQK